jgi:hypothetical protein
MPRGGDQRLHAERRRAAQDGADIMRIGDLIEYQHDAVRLEVFDIGSGEGIGFRQ